MAIVLAFTDAEDGTGGIAAVVGSTVGTTNNLYVAAFADDPMFALAGSRSGDGGIAYLAPVGGYIAYVINNAAPNQTISNVKIFEVTDATPTLPTPAGAYIVPMANLATLLSESENTQEFLGIDPLNPAAAALALARIHFPDFEADRVRDYMPCLVISYGDAWDWETKAGGSQNYLWPRGTFTLFAFDVARDMNGDQVPADEEPDIEQVSRTFGNAIGLIAGDLAAVAALGGNLAIGGMHQFSRPLMCSLEEQRSGGLYFEAGLSVEWAN